LLRLGALSGLGYVAGAHFVVFYNASLWSCAGSSCLRAGLDHHSGGAALLTGRRIASTNHELAVETGLAPSPAVIRNIIGGPPALR
jgi:hypothetical protein